MDLNAYYKNLQQEVETKKEQYGPFDRLFGRISPEDKKQIQEIKDEMAYIKSTVKKICPEVWQVQVKESLPDDNFGECDSLSGEIAINIKAIKDRLLEEVLRHEELHANYAKKSKGGTIGGRTQWLEGLNHWWTEKILGRVVNVYQEAKAFVQQMAEKSGLGLKKLLKWYRQGNDRKLREVAEWCEKNA